MKAKIIYLAVILLLPRLADAQNFGIKGGVNFANVTLKADGASLSPEWLTGYHLGMIMDFDLNNNLHFIPGLLYSVKGFSGEDLNTKVKMELKYIDVPLDLAYKIHSGEKTAFLIQAGPYLGFGTSVKETAGEESQSGSFSDAKAKGMDFGLGLGAGIELDNVRISYNYQIGLADINDDSTIDMAMKNKVSQISLAFMFGKK